MMNVFVEVTLFLTRFPMKEKYLINITGPTGVGKTDLSIELALKYEAEIFSSDSRQIYKEMNIGTAKPDQATLDEVPHHFINHCSIENKYSAGKYEVEALSLLQHYFYQRNKKVAILCGGTGLYINALINGLDVFPDIADDTRDQVNDLFTNNGIEGLQSYIKKNDPDYHQIVDLENPRRLSRAIEVMIQSGQSYTSFLSQEKQERPFESIHLILMREREELYDRINRRVEYMFQSGLLAEVESLFEFRHLRSLQTVGYQELFKYFEGQCTLEEAKEEIKKNSRRYAKRQITWLKRYETRHFHPEDREAILKYLTSKLG